MDRLELEMGAGQVEVRGLGNARCHSIALSAAAGKFIVDCSGEWKESTSLHVDAGMCDVEIHVPADLAVRVDATEAMFADVSFPDFREMRDGIYESPACRDREPQLLILLDT